MGPWVTYAEDGNYFSKIIIGGKADPAALIAQLTVM